MHTDVDNSTAKTLKRPQEAIQMKLQRAINVSAKRKKITYRKTQKKNIQNANSTMNVSANSYNRNANDY